jgi:hypothetical protein
MVTVNSIWNNHNQIADKTYQVISALHTLHSANDFVAAQPAALLAWVELRSKVEYSEWVNTMPPSIDHYFLDKFSSETVTGVAMQLLAWLGDTNLEVRERVCELRDADELTYA